MPDNKSDRGEPDRSEINIHEPYEVEYWSKRLGVTPDELRTAVTHVGPSVRSVEREIKNKD